MDTCVLHAQSLKRVGVGQHRTPLLDQGGEATGEVVRLSHAERKHLLGFLWGWRTTQGGQAQRDAIGLLALAHPVVLGPPRTAMRWERHCSAGRLCRAPASWPSGVGLGGSWHTHGARVRPPMASIRGAPCASVA